MLRELLKSQTRISLTDEQISRITAFHALVLKENETQNLTRLLSDQDFFEGHIVDAIELHQCGFLQSPVLDLGSGMGSPGLISALLFGGKWVLCDSETHKADFMRRASTLVTHDADLSVTSERAEGYLTTHRVGTVTAKAVGTVEKLYGWIEKCSTWNNLVLLKGPKWEEEWGSFQKSRYRDRLRIEATHAYTVGADEKQRKIIQLVRTK